MIPTMHHSRCLVHKVLASPSWQILKNQVSCTSGFISIQHVHLRHNSKKTTTRAASEVAKLTQKTSGTAAKHYNSENPDKDATSTAEMTRKLQLFRRREDIAQLLSEYFSRPEVKIKGLECGLDDVTYRETVKNLRTITLEVDPLPKELQSLFDGVLLGTKQLDDLFLYFVRHATILFPTKSIITDENRINAISSLEERVTHIRTFTSTERNFITPLRAMQEYLLQPHDLNGLRKTLRRSPHADEPPILVYWRRDVEARANEIWGGKENIRKEKRSRIEGPEYHDALGDVRSILKKYRKEHKDSNAANGTEKSGLLEGSGRIVITAVVINGSNFVIKLLAWYMTGSHSLFAEAIHSLADTINQLILAYGIHKSTQSANVDHPYGYTNMRHVASLISGVGIFCVGAGLSFYHGLSGLVGMHPVESLYWALCILAGSLVSEGATLYLACNSVRKRAKEVNLTFREFILRGRDPSLNVVILEDTAAVAGVVIAASCMALTMYTQSPIPDAAGSLAIGGLLGGVASFIIYSNSAALVGRSIPRDNLERINTELENDVMIRAIHDVKGIDMGNNKVRYKAEVDFDGRELTRAYLEKQDLEMILEEVATIKTQEELENFILKHGENIVDTLGAEIDRIEKRLRKSHPEIRHCDLEIL